MTFRINDYVFVLMICTEYREIIRISLYSVRVRKNADQNSSECGYFLRSAKAYDEICFKTFHVFLCLVSGNYSPHKNVNLLTTREILSAQYFQKLVVFEINFAGKIGNLSSPKLNLLEN